MALICVPVFATAKFFGLDDEALSPDGRFLVHLVVIDRSWKFEVKDERTNQRSLFDADCNPIHVLKWSADSRTILLVLQASEGTFAGMIHWNGERWIETDLSPTKEDDKTTLLSWKVRGKFVHLDYLVHHEAGRDKEGNRKFNVYRYNFDVPYSTRRFLHGKKSFLTDEQAHALKSDFST